jgi:kynurenine formamidase
MGIVDITGPIENGMWSYPDPYPKVEIREIPVPDWIAYPTYSWEFSLSAQSGTYLETAAHMFQDAPTIDQVPVERFFLDAAVIKVGDKQANEPIRAAELAGAQVEIRPGDALLVCTGWDRNWYDTSYVAQSPHFTLEAMHWILDQQISLMGADLPRFDSWENPQQFFGDFFRRDILLLAPLVNLGAISHSRVRLIALPLKIKGVCGTPCRAVVLES